MEEWTQPVCSWIRSLTHQSQCELASLAPGVKHRTGVNGKEGRGSWSEVTGKQGRHQFRCQLSEYPPPSCPPVITCFSLMCCSCVPSSVGSNAVRSNRVQRVPSMSIAIYQSIAKVVWVDRTTGQEAVMRTLLRTYQLFFFFSPPPGLFSPVTKKENNKLL
ncbi:unnamed protein product [Pleuronectes platessa]|uniref:Uncharacterized protein n=1 Tax=Pleuronectes platessa TaxID=8262 RepID=A0A9N7UML5_PLEPL|nr:unnamed protein product [Pleuronectes platessa]